MWYNARMNTSHLSRLTTAAVLLLAGCLQLPTSAPQPRASLDGKDLELSDVTLSAGPINKIFDGQQRARSQTKHGWMLTADLAKPGVLTVDLGRPVPDDLVIRPFGRLKDWSVDDTRILIPVSKPEQFVLTSPAGKMDDIHVFINPPFRAPSATGPVRRFARGHHHPGLLAPVSGETIILDEGAVVHAEVFLHAVTNVTICGRGTFDFSEWDRADERAQAFRRERGLPAIDTEFACNPFAVYASSDIRIEGVTLKDAPFWTLIIRNGSAHVDIDNIKIVGNWRYNSDGINVQASSHVRVHGSFLRTFDDCLVARAAYMEGDDGLPTEHLLFERNVLWCDWGKNCEVWAGHKPTRMQDIVFRNNAFANIHFTGCDVTTWFCSADTQIRDVLFADNEYDLAEPRWKTVFQSRPDEPFNLERETELNLVSVDAWKPAKNLGNQHFGPAEDESLYNLVYENISFVRPRVLGGGFTKITAKSETSTPYQRIRGLRFEGLPAGTEVTTKGNVELSRADAGQKPKM